MAWPFGEVFRRADERTVAIVVAGMRQRDGDVAGLRKRGGEFMLVHVVAAGAVGNQNQRVFAGIDGRVECCNERVRAERVLARRRGGRIPERDFDFFVGGGVERCTLVANECGVDLLRRGGLRVSSDASASRQNNEAENGGPEEGRDA